MNTARGIVNEPGRCSQVRQKVDVVTLSGVVTARPISPAKTSLAQRCAARSHPDDVPAHADAARRGLARRWRRARTGLPQDAESAPGAATRRNAGPVRERKCRVGSSVHVGPFLPTKSRDMRETSLSIRWQLHDARESAAQR